MTSGYSPTGLEPGSERPEGEAILHGSTFRLALAVIRKRVLVKAVFSLVATIGRRFFFDQFVHKFKPGSVPVRNIEHPLDAGIPVRYESVGVYLTFVKLWVSAIGYLRHELGPSFDEDMADFLAGIERCYSDASSVYSRCLSTTRRPPRAPSLRLAMVYAVDPHLFCVPSLHVLLVCFTYHRVAELLEARGAKARFAGELRVLRARAVAITESILYVRQHSVNCIPTALAMLSVILPSYDAAEATAFLSELFAGDDDIPQAQRAAAFGYMAGLYERLMASGSGHDEIYGAIADFVEKYEEMYLI